MFFPAAAALGLRNCPYREGFWGSLFLIPNSLNRACFALYQHRGTADSSLNHPYSLNRRSLNRGVSVVGIRAALRQRQRVNSPTTLQHFYYFNTLKYQARPGSTSIPPNGHQPGGSVAAASTGVTSPALFRAVPSLHNRPRLQGASKPGHRLQDPLPGHPLLRPCAQSAGRRWSLYRRHRSPCPASHLPLRENWQLSVPANRPAVSGHRPTVVFTTLDFLCVDLPLPDFDTVFNTIGRVDKHEGWGPDTSIFNIIGRKDSPTAGEAAREAAVQLLLGISNGTFAPSDPTSKQRLFDRVLFIVSHPRTFFRRLRRWAHQIGLQHIQGLTKRQVGCSSLDMHSKVALQQYLTLELS